LRPFNCFGRGSDFVTLVIFWFLASGLTTGGFAHCCEAKGGVTMADENYLVVLTFEGMGTAAAVYAQLEQMEKEHLVKIADAIIIERGSGEPPGSAPPVELGSGQGVGSAPTGPAEEHVRVVQTHGKKGKYAASGGGIGLLAGFLLGGPVGAAVVGAGLGAVTAAIKDFGIDDASLATIQARLQPNSSALLVLGQVRERDAYVARLRAFDPQVVSTTLTPEVEKELRERLAT
jgi:uncharacterized membrane protein